MKILRGMLAGVFLVAGAGVFVPFEANAAQVTISNCQSTKVRICAYDAKNGYGNTGSDNLVKNKQHKFTCNANCYFRIVDCSEHASCDQCKDNGHWVAHGWGAGTYNLVSLDRDSSGDYKSGVLEKTTSSTICE